METILYGMGVCNTFAAFINNIKPMLTFITNLFTIVRQVPGIIGIVKAILDVVGSDAVKQIIAAVRDVILQIKTETPDEVLPDATPAAGKRLVDRIKERIGQRFLNMDDQTFASYKSIYRHNTTGTA